MSSDSFSFEKAYERLETILKTLSEGDVALDKSLNLYEEASSLIASCNSQLKSAEQRIEVLLKNEDGTIALNPDNTVKTAPLHTSNDRLISREV